MDVGADQTELMALCALWEWKEIRNCPGRFVTKKNRTAVMTHPSDILETIGCNQELGIFEVVGKDKIGIVHFTNGGGLITYMKEEKDGSTRFIHTLNTESGFRRKIDALGLTGIVD